jgi:hypothetical protein
VRDIGESPEQDRRVSEPFGPTPTATPSTGWRPVSAAPSRASRGIRRSRGDSWSWVSSQARHIEVVRCAPLGDPIEFAARGVHLSLRRSEASLIHVVTLTTGCHRPISTRRAARGARTIAILGNPNAGKSTLFNQLTGLRQRVGNYPGVTVEKKMGSCELPSGQRAEVLDLPGSYSLHPNSPDEVIVRDVLLGFRYDTPPPDLILFVVDATHLERHLDRDAGRSSWVVRCSSCST